MREFVGGIASLARGFAYWRRRPQLMARGLIPAAIVAVLAIAGLVSFGVALPGVTEAMTPFADGWPGIWPSVIRAAIGTAMLGAALVILAVSFTALTLIVGEPFYDRIWRSVERDLGSGVPDADYGLWRSIRDGLSLVARGAGIAAVAGLLGLVPLVGGVLGFVFGVLFTGWLLADELASRALTARGLDADARRELLRANRARVLGFGVATQLCFMIPFGAILTMPGAVAGSTTLARSLVAAGPRQGVH
ncbi:MAG TPA: EI24 domain-containing protein [Microbacterium sp.]|uniref:EI24 domain-containing protein n=1 Tax=Microbacterium sp. TaxID=51671 RepID=UPI002C769215|nr:EI24 domain-containing protein [Microbacterium sp.]HWI30306.1 EI24 domain-containing protein [Microbacterium sp.]